MDNFKSGDFVGVDVGGKARCPILKVKQTWQDRFTLLWPEGIETIEQAYDGTWIDIKKDELSLLPPRGYSCGCYRCRSPLFALALSSI